MLLYDAFLGDGDLYWFLIKMLGIFYNLKCLLEPPSQRMSARGICQKPNHPSSDKLKRFYVQPQRSSDRSIVRKDNSLVLQTAKNDYTYIAQRSTGSSLNGPLRCWL